jgi:hypothetical protein
MHAQRLLLRLVMHSIIIQNLLCVLIRQQGSDMFTPTLIDSDISEVPYSHIQNVLAIRITELALLKESTIRTVLLTVSL